LAPINFLDSTGTRIFKEYSNAVDINTAGWVFLTADDQKGIKKAYLWDGVTMQTVNDLVREDTTLFAPFTVPAYIYAGSIENQPTFAVAINDNPTVTGEYQYVCNSGDSAFVYDGFNITTLNQFNGSPLVAVDMNNQLPVGHVVGDAGNDGFFWDGGVIYPIRNPSGAPVTVVDINNNDIVVGNSGGQAFVWHRDPTTKIGVFEALGSLGGGSSTAGAINDNGVVIGKSATGTSVTAGGITYAVEHAFAWRNEIIYDLGTHVPTYLYPIIPDYPFSEAVAITETNTIVGNSYSINAHKRGFIISPTIP
jgi:probable HAF family extracellular repeat protein